MPTPEDETFLKKISDDDWKETATIKRDRWVPTEGSTLFLTGRDGKVSARFKIIDGKMVSQGLEEEDAE